MDAASVTTRAATSDDWTAICRVHDAARPLELAAGQCDARAFVPLADDPEGYELASSHIRVACTADGAVVAFVAVRHSYVSFLYVDPTWHRQGIGRRLLRESFNLVEEKAWTIALRHNAAAVTLYESEGFRVVRRWRDDNEGWPCDVVRLERDI